MTNAEAVGVLRKLAPKMPTLLVDLEGEIALLVDLEGEIAEAFGLAIEALEYRHDEKEDERRRIAIRLAAALYGRADCMYQNAPAEASRLAEQGARKLQEALDKTP